LRGSTLPASVIDLRGPGGKVQTTPSLRPLKWQLAQPCQPAWDRRSSVETVVPAGRL
jgi:hypothetical protein